jgi:cell division protease FtsH
MATRSSDAQKRGWDDYFGPGMGAGRTGTPPWVWLLIIGILALVFWQFVPRAEVQVQYAPWFLDQVDSENIQSISIHGLEVHGVLRKSRPFQPPRSEAPIAVRRFSTYFPSEASIEPIVQRLTANRGGDSGTIPVVIDVEPPNSANSVAWIMLLLPTLVILGFIWLMMRRARLG